MGKMDVLGQWWSSLFTSPMSRCIVLAVKTDATGRTEGLLTPRGIVDGELKRKEIERTMKKMQEPPSKKNPSQLLSQM